MKRTMLLSGAAILMGMVLAADFGLADEKGEEHDRCPMCPPGEMMGERPMVEQEGMRHMMERMMAGREAHRRMSLSPSELQEELKLSPEQMDVLKPIETDYRKVTIKKTADIRVAEVELAALLDRKKPDVGALKQKVKEIGELQADLMMYRVESLLKLREILSEEQHERFKALLRERMERFSARGAPHGMSMSP